MGSVAMVSDRNKVLSEELAHASAARQCARTSLKPDDLPDTVTAVPAPSSDDAGPLSEDARLGQEIDLCRSPKMRDVWDIVRQAAGVDVTVLICGETGTGKDLVARGIHQLSSRRNQPFVKVNCAAVPRELLESELFGHERGAFTGAHQLKIGKFESANHGTVFLDEIGDLHQALQAKLLHVLQDGTFSRVGGKSAIKVDVRIVAATNQNLERAVLSERFREDLYYRLNVIQITVPPLRERTEEIPALAEYFVQRYSRLLKRPRLSFSASAMDRLMQHRYPGNVRELENVVKRMIVLNDPLLTRIPLAGATSDEGGSAGTETRRGLKEIGRTAARVAEREAIEQALRQTNWNRVKAARILRISYRALLYKIKEARLDGGWPGTRPAK
ncbi:MAG: sigma-54 interaction domain-containing protein [Candidatus Rokuibacteriota bacterium]